MRLNIRTWGVTAAILCWTLSGSLALAQVPLTPLTSIRIASPASAAATIIDVLEWDGDYPSRIAVREEGSGKAFTLDVDPQMFRAARLSEARVPDEGPTLATLSLPAEDGTLRDVFATFSERPGGLDGLIEDPSRPGAVLAFSVSQPVDGEGGQSPRTWWYWGIGGFVALVIIVTCGTIETHRQETCAVHAQQACGIGNVECATTEGACGVGRCTYICKGSAGRCGGPV